ncbi:MAG: DUF4330 domain-containing protein [Oscillospiraceae bacterium]|jgi:hypothetical protein|nr:DUF4330 domain-containing protein [Oscillospiraceae bacterium]
MEQPPASQQPPLRKKRLNIADIVIIVLVVLAAGFFVMRYAMKSPPPPEGSPSEEPSLSEEPSPSPEDVRFTAVFATNELMTERFEGKIAAGDEMVDKNTGVVLGVITDILIEPSLVYTTNAQGEIVMTTRPLHSKLTVTIEGEGHRPEQGGLRVERFHSMLNKEYEVYVNDISLWLRFNDFTLHG